MHLFYTPDIQVDQTYYNLSEEESKHCIKVLRLQLGDIVALIDGRGNQYEAHIADISSKKVRVKIVAVTSNVGHRDYYLHVGIAPTKRMERFEWFLEKATEIGIDEITPLITHHSERRDVNAVRMKKIVVAAMKQSLQAFLPKLNPATKFSDFMEAQRLDGQRFIAHCAPDFKQTLSDTIQKGNRYLILIGPEGDFNPQEIVYAKELNYQPISLGESRLRTETAGIAACLEVNFLNR